MNVKEKSRPVDSVNVTRDLDLLSLIAWDSVGLSLEDRAKCLSELILLGI